LRIRGAKGLIVYNRALVPCSGVRPQSRAMRPTLRHQWQAVVSALCAELCQAKGRCRGEPDCPRMASGGVMRIHGFLLHEECKAWRRLHGGAGAVMLMSSAVFSTCWSMGVHFCGEQS